MKIALALLIPLSALPVAMQGQAAPSATTGASTLHYSLRCSEATYMVTNQSASSTAMGSGDVGYVNGSKRLPFTLDFSGGYGFVLAGLGTNAGAFENMRLSQGAIWRASSLSVSDNVSYRHQAPTTGFSGVAGTGETGAPTGDTTQTILTENTSTLNNNALANFQQKLNRSISVNAGGAYEILDYPDGTGIDTETRGATGGATLRLNARNDLTSGYSFSRFSYHLTTATIDSQVASLGFQRQWTRTIHTVFSAGPRWLSSSGQLPNGTNSQPLPNSISYSLNAAIDDEFRFGTAHLAYSHGANGGGGYLLGAVVDAVNANLDRQFGARQGNHVGIQAGYRRTSGLVNNGVTNALFCTTVANHRIGRNLGVFASYALSHQSTSSLLPTNALSGLTQVISVGAEFSPRHLR